MAQVKIRHTELEDGRIISTIDCSSENTIEKDNWLYETMVFNSSDDFSELTHKRYKTAAEAITGHTTIVNNLLDLTISRFELLDFGE